MGIFWGDKVKGKFFVDGVEVGEIQTATIDTDRPEYEAIKLPNLREISLSGTFTMSRQNGKTGFAWALIKEYCEKRLAEWEAAERIRKQIRRSSYRKTKSQRRRRS